MLQQKVYDFFHLLRSDNLSLFYQGVTHDDITDKLISLSDENIRSQSELERIRKRVSVAISECFQNLIRHKDTPLAGSADQFNKPSMFMIRNFGRNYYIGSANLLKNEKASILKKQFGSLHKLNPTELKQLYLDLLLTTNFSDKGGAGLGLIEMARKSKQRFEFDVFSVNRVFSLFFMQLSFCTEEPKKEDVFTLLQVQNMYESLLEQNVLLLYKSDFSQDGMLPIVDMMENNLSKVSATRLMQKKVMYVLVEMFQNIVKHAVASADGRQEGVLMIATAGDDYELFTGNYVKNQDVAYLNEHIGGLNQLNQQELKTLYRKELTKTSKSEKGGAGLGLIETARYSSKPFCYGFIPVNDQLSFFTLGIKV